MYNVLFKGDHGLDFKFGAEGSNVFDMDLGSGLDVNMGLSQGFSQAGQTVETQNVSGRGITVNGVIIGDTYSTKLKMRRAFAPFVTGTLFFNDEYFIRVYVKHSPSFSTSAKGRKFSMQFFAPFPFFYSNDKITKYLGKGLINPNFSFPINYNEPHMFGKDAPEVAIDLPNEGDIAVPFSATFMTTARSKNPEIINLKTLRGLKINGIIEKGDKLDVYRNADGVLKAELTKNGNKSDVIQWIDEKSDLFNLEVGSNPIKKSDTTDGEALEIIFSYNTAVVGLYEN